MKIQSETHQVTNYTIHLSDREYMLIYMALCSVNMLKVYDCFDYLSEKGILLPDDMEYGKLFTQLHDNLEESSCLL